jgi:hypothetical protein
MRVPVPESSLLNRGNGCDYHAIADANGEDEREHPVVPISPGPRQIVGTEPLPMTFVIRGSVKEETVMDRQENSVLEAGWLLAVPLSIGFAVLIAGLVLG